MKTYTQQDALDLLDNVQPWGANQRYWADEGDAWYSFSEEDLGELVSLMNSDDEEIATSAYSHWCASYGDEITEGQRVTLEEGEQGVIDSMEKDDAWVRWDSGIATECPLELLSPISEED